MFLGKNIFHENVQERKRDNSEKSVRHKKRNTVDRLLGRWDTQILAL